MAGLELRVPIINLIIHDWTKFLPVEWNGYTEWFYGGWRKIPDTARDKAPKDVTIRFDMAWNHHQKHNRHHWQYWIVTYDEGPTILLPMPDKDRREMLADWIGAGLAIHGKKDVKEWYLKQRDKVQLHPETREWVEKQLGL